MPGGGLSVSRVSHSSHEAFVSNVTRSLRALLPIVACALSVTAIAVPCRAGAQIVATPGASTMAPGPRLPLERIPSRVTLRGEHAAATRVAHRDTTFRMSTLAIVLAVILLVILI